MTTSGIDTSAFGALDYAKQGMKRAEQKLNDAAAGIASGDITSSRMVEMIESKSMYSMNAQVLRTQDEMLGTLLDVKR